MNPATYARPPLMKLVSPTVVPEKIPPPQAAGGAGEGGGIGGLVDVVKSPQFATAVGLVMYGAQQAAGSPYFKIREENVYRKVKSRMKEWLGEIF